MRGALVVFLFSAIVAVGRAYRKAPLVGLAHATSTISDEYVVVFNEDVGKNEEWQHRARVVEMQSEQDKMDSFHIGNLRGYSAQLSEKAMDKVRDMRGVAYVERNQVVSIANEETECLVQMHAIWGLVRTASRNLPTSKKYPFKKNAGNGVKVYVLDTGIDKSHPEFEGRAIMGANFVPEQSSHTKTRIHGHGTHVAGTIASRRFGVAKQATVVDVRVLGSTGKGSLLSVLAGISWVAWSHKHDKKGKSIVNLSLGSRKSFVLNAAVNQLVLMGVHVATSAGNNGKSACFKSPSSALKSVTVAASDKSDKFFSASNHGKCVDIIAPGVRILSLWPGKRYAIASGTSMAAPHVAGVMAKILSNDGILTPQQMKDKLKKGATRDKITRLPSGTPNLLLYNNNCN